jgi:Domain of unknown function (DUF4177)
MRWEYLTVKFNSTGFFTTGTLDGDAFNGKLNELGEQGWELVTVFDTNWFQGGTRDVVAVFKRPVR